MNPQSKILVALGGNAISRHNEVGNVDQQFANSRITARALADLIDAGHQLIITHGNGPQIGNFLLRNRAAAGVIYPLPMEVAVAHVQGGMGFMIAQCLMNELASRGRARVVTTIVTTVLVDRNDPSFRKPSKPIGHRMNQKDAERMAAEEGWVVSEISPGVYRRLVASPTPKRIMEIDLIRQVVDAGHVVVACGGGGIPVIDEPKHGLRGVAAVIDKDLASALLATKLCADAMMILTDVDRVSINYGKSDERAIERMTLDEARRYLDEGQFPAGSMGPKVKGAVNFLTESPNETARVIIGPLDRATDAVAGRIGTCITKS